MKGAAELRASESPDDDAPDLRDAMLPVGERGGDAVKPDPGKDGPRKTQKDAK